MKLVPTTMTKVLAAGFIIKLLLVYNYIRGIKRMEKSVDLGPEAKAGMKIAEGKVILSLNYEGKQAGAQVSVSLDSKQYAAMLKAAIPGGIDDVIIDALVAIIEAV